MDQIWAILKPTAGRQRWPEANLSFPFCLQVKHPVKRQLGLEITVSLETLSHVDSESFLFLCHPFHCCFVWAG